MKYTSLVLLLAAHFSYQAEKRERSISINNKQSVVNPNVLANSTCTDSSIKAAGSRNSSLHVLETPDNLVLFVRHAVQLR